ncbi:solute carrier family 25 member 48 isoform X4 [Talpa occidentalis]|uniref:solute carrier family 25 member 48 isoform X4 n=1 Tax=Talpa occidentalis TaxID=50954 RepID=UPI0018905DA9|nr:solute carrier family 25 member 48 isoform X4 [Talpa occidentalis]XP_054550351.1 solute carrier family 25 member 48 isoform X4 [Talpa occidentalis]
MAGKNFLEEEEDPVHLSQQLQTTSSRGREPLSNLDIPSGALEYLPFFRTYGQLPAKEELARQPDICKDRGGDQTIREMPFSEDSGPPSGFFPYYRSKEENFPSLAFPGRGCGGSQDPSIKKEVQAGCFCRMTISDKCSAASHLDLVSGSSYSLTCCPSLLVSAGHSHHSGLDTLLSSDAASRSQALCASGFVPYYRTPEEGLHTSPGPPASPLGTPEAHRGAPQAWDCHTVREQEPAENKSPEPTDQQEVEVVRGEASRAQFVPGANTGLGPLPSGLFPCHSAHNLQGCQEPPSPGQSRPSSLSALSWTSKKPLHPASMWLYPGI